MWKYVLYTFVDVFGCPLQLEDIMLPLLLCTLCGKEVDLAKLVQQNFPSTPADQEQSCQVQFILVMSCGE